AETVYLDSDRINAAYQKEIKKMIDPMMFQLNIQHFKVDGLGFDGQNQMSAGGKIDIKDLHLNKSENGFTPDSIRFSSLSCDLSNIKYPLGANKTALIDHFMIDSEK